MSESSWRAFSRSSIAATSGSLSLRYLYLDDGTAIANLARVDIAEGRRERAFTRIASRDVPRRVNRKYSRTGVFGPSDGDEDARAGICLDVPMICCIPRPFPVRGLGADRIIPGFAEGSHDSGGLVFLGLCIIVGAFIIVSVRVYQVRPDLVKKLLRYALIGGIG